MSGITQKELDNIITTVNNKKAEFQKLNMYSMQCVDPQIKQIFTKAAQDSLNIKQKMLTFLD